MPIPDANPDDYKIKYDERGRPYYQWPGQPRRYVSPRAMDPNAEKPADRGGIFRGGWQWDTRNGKWVNPVDWSNIANIGVGAGLGLGGLDAAGVFGGAGAGAAGGGAGTGAGAGGAGAGAGAGAGGAGAGAAAGAGASAANQAIQAALAALAGLPALFTNRGPSDEEKALYAQARQLQQLQQRRIEHQNPLFSAVTQLAMSRLPTTSQQTLSPLVTDRG